VDRDGRPCPPGIVGELVTRGEHVLRFYWDDPAETRHAFRHGDGWLATGDLGTVDADGFITLVDRAKDMIVSGGENIYPVELENALFRHPAVADCAVFGIPDDHWGEVPVAHVVLRDGARANATELIAHVEHEVARWKRPRLVEFVAALPRTAVGKTRKDVLREPYWRNRQRRI
jgi:acyl-CoA synthetase (AMP-forming)/AMP-acid ligase II